MQWKLYPTAVEATPKERFSASDDNIPEHVDADAALERRILIKTDLRIMPILFLLFVVSFVDRVNIGNAKIVGLEASLGMVGNQYNIALFAFYLPYILLDLPSNLLLRRARPAWFLGGLMCCWGTWTGETSSPRKSTTRS